MPSIHDKNVSDVTLARVFLLIRDNKDITNKELINRLNKTTGTISQAVNELIGKGCVSLVKVTNDTGRRVNGHRATNHNCDYCARMVTFSD